MLPRLDGVHGLARDIEPVGKICLTPVAFGAQNFQPVFQRPSRQRKNWKMATKSSMKTSQHSQIT
jgi:hypothetical protein